MPSRFPAPAESRNFQLFERFQHERSTEVANHLMAKLINGEQRAAVVLDGVQHVVECT
jgi:hypothetical protein